MIRKYKYILFDLDGTLTDSSEGITKSLDYALSHFGIKTDNLDDLSKFIGPALIDTFKNSYGFNEVDANKCLVKYRERFTQKGIYENKVYDGIEDVLKKLKNEGKILIVATSKPTVFANIVLKYFELDKYFSFVAGSELDGTRDEKSAVIAYALEQNNITDLSEAVMIGDRKYDIIGAKKNGVASIGVLYGFGDRNELEHAGADFIVDTVYELEIIK